MSAQREQQLGQRFLHLRKKPRACVGAGEGARVPSNRGDQILSSYNFIQLDVFTDQPFCGNPLAVFPEGDGISDEQMQQIAREMNLSETVFVLPSEKEGALRKLRIFTPGSEYAELSQCSLFFRRKEHCESSASSRREVNCPSPAIRSWAPGTVWRGKASWRRPRVGPAGSI